MFNMHDEAINKVKVQSAASVSELQQLQGTINSMTSALSMQLGAVNVHELAARIYQLETNPTPTMHPHGTTPPHAIKQKDEDRGIMEFKAISNLRSFQQKDSFKLWNERLMNGFDQAFPGAKALIK